MEATHFIEVYKSGWSKNLRNTSCSEIDLLERFLKETECKRTLQTIAVWRIQKTDVPLQERLAKRYIGGFKYEYIKPFHPLILNQ